MDLEDVVGKLEEDRAGNPLVQRHLAQLRALGRGPISDCAFGICRLLQAHEALVYALYARMRADACAGFHGYRLLGAASLAHGEAWLSGRLLALGPDAALGRLVGCDLAISELSGTDAFFDALVHTPMPFVFVPDAALLAVADFVGGVFGPTPGGVGCGTAGAVSFLVLEPLTLESVGLGFLCRDVLEDEGVCALLCGFAHWGRVQAVDSIGG